MSAHSELNGALDPSDPPPSPWLSLFGGAPPDAPPGNPAEVLVRAPISADSPNQHAGDRAAPPPASAPQNAPPDRGAGVPEAIDYDAGVVLADIPADGVGVSFGDTFKLHSNPTSTYKIYLDFDGHTTSGNSWNTFLGGPSFYSSAFSLDGSEAFNAAELQRVQQIWQRVAEYFSPFNIDVTTEDPGVTGLTRSGNGDKAFGIRVVITDEAGRSGGGVAWLGSFDWSSGEAAFVYANNLGDGVKAIADAAAHEAGHSLGLEHDGQVTANGGNPYYAGHGSGVTDWAPAMGVGYQASIVQWSRGEYYGANNTQDDLAIITSQNSGVGYVADDYGNTFRRAATLGGTTSGSTTNVQTWGVISGSGANNDVDMFRFDVAQGGSIDLTISSWTRVYVGTSGVPIYDQSANTMLDLAARLYDAAGQLVAVSDDPARVDAAISVAGLKGGTYYLALDGVGWGDPLAPTPTGYTEYGSLGQYMIQGSYTAPGASVAALRTSTSAITIGEDGAARSFRVYLADTSELTPDTVTVQLSGLDSTEGALSQTTLTLTRDGGWSTEVTIGGLNDRDDDGDTHFELGLSAGGFGTASVGVTNLDNDGGPASVGSRFGVYSKAPMAGNTKLAALTADDGSAMTLREGVSGDAARLEWRWQFDNLPTGQKIVHVDATSTNEAMRFEYSEDGAAWTSLSDGAPEAAVWNGSYAVTATGSTLWIRVADTETAGDSLRDTFSIDLLTVEHLAQGTAQAWILS